MTLHYRERPFQPRLVTVHREDLRDAYSRDWRVGGRSVTGQSLFSACGEPAMIGDVLAKILRFLA